MMRFRLSLFFPLLMVASMFAQPDYLSKVCATFRNTYDSCRVR